MLVDTNIFLEVLLQQNKSEQCKKFLREVLERKKLAFISSFTIDSIILSMTRYNIKNERIRAFIFSLSKYKGLKIYPVSIKDRINALELMEKYSLDYEDSITLQSALSLKCAQIISFDKHFDKVSLIERKEP
ncbi:type II toxin-antitoxin system VapC family toxin [Candidatus Pacearchaeota archaeon]|nr:type II toxin-antitoxin system VapC family toxin [Candidatus Pacearchaeota archaeon]